MIGNPHGLAGTFYDAFHKNRKQFHTVHISAFDTPAFTEAGITAENIADLEYPDPVTDTDVIPADNTVIPADAHVIPADAGTQGKTNHANSRIPYGLSTPRWALRLFNSHGPQSSVYQTRVAGQFPSEANDTLIALRDIEAAVKRPHLVQPDDKPIVGLDIARFGDDKTVIIVRHGMRVLHIEELRKSDLVNTTGRVITVADEFKARHIMIDEVGIGAGVLDTLKQDKIHHHRNQRRITLRRPEQIRQPSSTNLRRTTSTIRRRSNIHTQRSRIDLAVGVPHLPIQRTRAVAIGIQRNHQRSRQTKSR